MGFDVYDGAVEVVEVEYRGGDPKPLGRCFDPRFEEPQLEKKQSEGVYSAGVPELETVLDELEAVPLRVEAREDELHVGYYGLTRENGWGYAVYCFDTLLCSVQLHQAFRSSSKFDRKSRKGVEGLYADERDFRIEGEGVYFDPAVLFVKEGRGEKRIRLRDKGSGIMRCVVSINHKSLSSSIDVIEGNVWEMAEMIKCRGWYVKRWSGRVAGKDLRNNHLCELPFELTELAELKNLGVAGNPFSDERLSGEIEGDHRYLWYHFGLPAPSDTG